MGIINKVYFFNLRKEKNMNKMILITMNKKLKRKSNWINLKEFLNKNQKLINKMFFDSNISI